jgi:hypothetical protein
LANLQWKDWVTDSVLWYFKLARCAGQNVYVTLSNKAKGSAPLFVIELAKEINAGMR